MSRIAEVITSDRYADDDGPQLDVRVDKTNATDCPHFGCAGDDSCPLPGDYAALDESDYSPGGEQITGYADGRNAGVALPGEKRIYARNSAGEPTAEVHLRGDGSITVENLINAGRFRIAANGEINLNGVIIDTDGNISTPGNVSAEGDLRAYGEVTALALVPATAITLTGHGHTSAAPGAPTSPSIVLVPDVPGP